MKKCPTCKEEKIDTDFYFFKGKPHGHCKKCHRIHSRKHSLKKEYGLTIEEYELMFSSQSGLCLICQTPGHSNNRQKYPLYVDHNHETGKVRGLLCATCNTMLGYLEVSRHLLLRMETYLQKDGLI